MRALYVLLTYLLAPILVAMEAWQELRRPAWRGRVRERFGGIDAPSRPGSVWVHAVSVGEVQAAAALVRELQRRRPDLDVVMTTVTPTGAAQVRKLFGDQVRHCYMPYDLPGSARRFLDRLQPQIAVILETEIWPTLYAALRRREIPLVLASARLTERSVSRFRRVKGLSSEALSGDVVVGAQSDRDAARFVAIGAPAARVTVTGNVKFDLEVPDAAVLAGRAQRLDWGRSRPVWIAGSTHEGEEAAALDAHALVRDTHPEALLILAPRHPQRFDDVCELLDQRRTRYVRRTSGQAPAGTDEVVVLDTLGELVSFYAASDVAFVGGSLVRVGGHNLLEPAVLALPVLSGPHVQNAAEIAALLRGVAALTIVHDAVELARAVATAFDAPVAAAEAGERGRTAVAASRGAVGRVLALVEPRLSSPGAPRASSSAGSGAH